MKLGGLACLVVLLGISTQASAADTPESSCSGVASILRISEYVADGSEAGLREAAAQHTAWYRSHGVTENEQVVIPLMTYDADSDALNGDTQRVATLHLNANASRDARDQQGDDAWQAFIAEYQKNTEVTETLWLCLPAEVFNTPG
ncbi:MAG: hypothetical protein EVA67_10435 [OM182 bacterium]|nr:MAG: hypothetical protein EVA67_10435 [OM182 bacterium]|tara:strand:- start:2420 stop:2857 length:438 start_codon:yes stop_codon:yes gene_type:complete